MSMKVPSLEAPRHSTFKLTVKFRLDLSPSQKQGGRHDRVLRRRHGDGRKPKTGQDARHSRSDGFSRGDRRVLEGVVAHALLRSTGRGPGRFRATLATHARELLSGGNRARREKTSLPLAGPR